MDYRQSGSPFISCKFLRGYIFLGDEDVRHCCGTGREFTLAPIRRGEFIPDELFTDSRRRIEDALNSGQDCPCSGCPYLETRTWPETEYVFDAINFSQSDTCNLDCVYCFAPQWKKGRDDGSDCRYFLPVLADMYDRKLLAPDALIILNSGEPLMMHSLDEVVELVMTRSRGRIFFASNLTHRSAAIETWLDANRVDITCSLDCGTRETYKKIRRRDLFDAVVANIRHYAGINPATLSLKYICLPGNLNPVDRDGFLDVATGAGLRRILISVNHVGKIDDKIMDFMGEFKYLAGRRGLTVEMDYDRLDGIFPDVPVRKKVEAGYRRWVVDYRDVLQKTVGGDPKGWLEQVIRANDGGLWLGGWAYDKATERRAREIVVFWRDEPLFAGVCRFIKEYVRRGKDTGFSFHSGDRELADAVLGNPAALRVCADFGDGIWCELSTLPNL